MEFWSDARYSMYDSDFSWWFMGNPVITVSGFVAFWLQGTVIYVLLFWLHEKRVNWLTGLALLAALPLLIALRYGIQEVLTDVLFGVTNYHQKVSFLYYFFDNVYYTFLFGSFSVFYFYLRLSRHKQRLEAEAELQRKKAELDYLKSQVNPHFLFNNLNSIYSLVHARSDKALPALEHLSELLRYGLYEKAPLVSMEKEWEMLGHYISLQRLRHDHPLPLQMTLGPEARDAIIPPLSLIPLVENAFKHGLCKTEEHPIRIEIEKKGNLVLIEIANSRADKQKDHEGGVGLENVKRRLQLLFPERHTFEIIENKETFTVRMTVPAP